VCEALGYPSQPTLSRWLRDDPRHAPRAESGSGGEKGGRMSYSFEVRLEAVRLAEEEHMTRREVADKLGIRGAPMVTKWVTTACYR
ncbi:MAG: transposase, partial [Atopobiaceae bacterium]|nr:transposase [Atopobiaceae bacterium]